MSFQTLLGRRAPAALLLFAVAVACAPRLRPLGGDASPAALPRGELSPGHRHIVFDWEYSDPEMSGKGSGVARVASPDSARLDFFLAGGFAGGVAVLIGDSLQVPGIDLMRRVIPPPAMLWAALGRSAFPVMRDTAIRRDGGLLRADLGRPVEWRVTFRGDTLVRLEHVQGNRVIEWVDRGADDRLEYRQESVRRTLRLHVTRVENVAEFEASIWRIDR
jgi:hypothetical protein